MVSLVLFFTVASTDRRHLLWYGDWERGYDQHMNKTNVSHPLLSTLISNIMIGAHPHVNKTSTWIRLTCLVLVFLLSLAT